jgi:Flp pilus assembly pilin Flp
VLALYVRTMWRTTDSMGRSIGWLRRRAMTTVAGQEGQTTAEYALVILAAAAVALVLIAWARSSGKLPAFFDSIIDELTGSA